MNRDVVLDRIRDTLDPTKIDSPGRPMWDGNLLFIERKDFDSVVRPMMGYFLALQNFALVRNDPGAYRIGLGEKYKRRFKYDLEKMNKAEVPDDPTMIKRMEDGLDLLTNSRIEGSFVSYSVGVFLAYGYCARVRYRSPEARRRNRKPLSQNKAYALVSWIFEEVSPLCPTGFIWSINNVKYRWDSSSRNHSIKDFSKVL